VVAVVGASGSGKSTLVALLTRHWDVPGNSVLLDGRDVRDFDPDQVRECLSVAEQPVSILTGTLRENLAVAARGPSDAELMAILDRVGLAAIVRRLPDRLDSWVGELGVALSGGERQRLALARALLRQAPFLLLDEPTAHVDTESEAALFEELIRERSARGVLIATHRLGHLLAADEIIVLQDGRVVQRGDFHELSASPGWFSDALRIERDVIPD
jgi:ABC-type multidrug transport system fused ATPase/permease subunit